MNFLSDLSPREINLRKEIIDAICTGEQHIEYQEKYQPLIEKNVIVVENNYVTSVYPFSLTPSNKKVQLQRNDIVVYAMCAIDAIGIYYTLDEPITIYSEDELTKEKIVIDVKKHGIFNKSHHDVLVLYKPVCSKESCNTLCCPYIHFFTKKDHALEYLNSINKTQEEFIFLNLDEAKEISKELFQSH
ncbi:organomercurial lyase [Vagococcus lutrae]|uniref:organomercurial lyase n=1 Tax=Vagococcus lutrae TaxID=81947 RepID=UPI00288D84C8|nr:organomercurial lyase [Vagococcus lutrae]MDT2816273.1 organomercurial lyase [Vagococcus lutrae]